MYADVQMFMGKLQQLINCNDNELINNQSILCERPQFHLLYEELGSMIQTLFNHEDQDLHNFEEMKKLKKRFKAAAEEAEYIVDIFLSAVHCRNNRYSPISNVFQPYLHLEVVMRSIDSIKMEFMTMRMDNMKMDASQRTDRLQMQSSGTSRSRNSIGSNKVKEEMVVGFDRDAEIIRDKLAEDGKHLDVVSIVGMGGIGKSTLANKVFTDPFVVYHFHIRGWVTVSQTYDKRDLLIQVLSSIDDGLELEEATNSQLHQILHRSLYFAWHAKLHGLIHHLQHLTEEESWKLLCEKVFKGDECPKWLIKPGKQITKNCHGLPLSVVVMAGVLAKEPRHKDVWLKISYSVHSYMASDKKGCLETIALSYHHLPLHLRDCFLYLGGFPEDYKIHSPWLLWVWMAEGFIQEDGNQSLEEIAKGYLVDLVDRNLVIVQKRYLSGDIRRCKVHDLVRQLSVEKGKEERFFLKIEPPSIGLCDIIRKQINKLRNQNKVITTSKRRRVVTNQEIDIMSLSHPPTPSIRSLLCYPKKTTLTDNITEFIHFFSLRRVLNLEKFFRSFALLRVLHLDKSKLIGFPPGLGLLVHLRHLEIWLQSFPQSICNLWNLQTLFVSTSSSSMVLPSNISNLVNLRHLTCNADFYLPSIEKPMKLEVTTKVVLGDGVDNFQKCFPRIKRLTSTLYSGEENDFEVLHYLQVLMLIGPGYSRRNHIRFPATLKELTLVRCGLLWSDMSIIQSLPNLEILILKDNCFEGTLWETGEEPFQQLKFLCLEEFNIKKWESSSINFPCLKELQEQDDVGNYELEIIIDGRKMPSCVPKCED
ncbi:unnamed protein product [Lactuca saligna]|uniref:NB-ARC domain-containing protein n=1 Tax=Lactuca saligna TaxID=75948 RepID=A0AA35ZWL3_LACSI|nr:unnamed protein product [Lactuca saligna]